MGRVADAAASQSLAPATPKQTIEDVLKKNWGRIASVLPKHMSRDRLLSLSISTINKTPKLAECTPESLLSCFMRCSSLGLEPSDIDGLGRAYILPYGRQATFILGYRGMIDLARRSGEIKSIFAQLVYEGETFKRWNDETGQHFKHEPSDDLDPDTAKIKGAFVSTQFTNGGTHLEYMSIAEIEKVRKRSKAANNGPWVTDYGPMCLKSVVRKASKYWPLSTEVQNAIASDETDGGYVQTIDPIIDIEPMETETLPEPTTEPKKASAGAEGKPEAGLAAKIAVCKTCQNTIKDAPVDVTLEDLNLFLCCEKPDYKWAENA